MSKFIKVTNVTVTKEGTENIPRQPTNLAADKIVEVQAMPYGCFIQTVVEDVYYTVKESCEVVLTMIDCALEGGQV